MTPKEIPAGRVRCTECKGSGIVPNPAEYNARGDAIPAESRGQVSCPGCGGRGYRGKGAKSIKAGDAAA